MNVLELIGLKNLEAKLYIAAGRCEEDINTERQCKNVVPFIRKEIKEALEILKAIQENNNK